MIFDTPAILERIRRKFWFLDTLLDKLNRETAIKLGVTGPLLFRRPFTLRGKNLFTHKHIIGKTGYGKSNLMQGMIPQLIHQNIGVTLIDPHGDLATDCLWSLLDSGYFQDPHARERLLYIDFGVQDRNGNPTHLLPFNILNQSFNKYRLADILVDTCRRVWPYLELQGAPHFENVLKYSVVTLVDNNQPITKIGKLLGNKSFREACLQRVPDDEVVSFFHDRFDDWGHERARMLESTLNKVSLLVFSPVLRYSTGQSKNALDFREILRSGRSVLFNLAGLTHETQKFIGCLISIGFENAMLDRENIEKAKRDDYFLFMDEFPVFSTTSEESFNKFLSEARKYRVWLGLAHQTMSQISPRLQGSLQNTQRICFRLDRDDAKYMAERIGKFDLGEIRRDVPDETMRSKMLPHEKSIQESYEGWTEELETLYKGEAYVKLSDRTEKIKADLAPTPKTPYKTLKDLEAQYAQELMIERTEAIAAVDGITAPVVNSETETPPLPNQPTMLFTRKRSARE
jgi:hypothetical protein